MSPEARREFIIDAAIELVLEKGHSSFSLEQVAASAGISKPLIYKYFPNREELLQSILDREFKALRGKGLDKIPKDVPPEQIIRNAVERTLLYYHEHGPILRLLASDPLVRDMHLRGQKKGRANASAFFVKRLSEHYGLSKEVATIADTMVVNAPIQSMKYLKRQGIDIHKTIEIWTEFIIGGWQALEARYGEDS